jgi:hypothetical protein
MPARAQAKLFDTQEARMGVAFQNGSYEKVLIGTASTVGAVASNILFDSFKAPDPTGTSGGKLRIPEGTVVGFYILLTAANATDDPGTSLNYGQAFEIKGVIRNLNGVTAIPVAGITPVALDTTASHVLPAGQVVVTADAANNALNIAVTGVAAKTYYWRATAYLSVANFFGV